MRTLNELIQEGVNLFHAGEMERAEFLFDRLLAQHPGNTDIMGVLGSLYSKIGKNGAAIALLSASVEQAMEDKNETPGFWSNLAACLKRENHLMESELAFTHALELDPSNANTLANFSGLYINAGCPEKAEELARRAISTYQRDFTSFINIEGQQQDEVALHLARHHLGLALLEQGKWEEAWTYYDERKTTEGWQRPTYDIPLWKGEPTGTLVIHGEQGIGDEIMYLSLVDKIRHLAKEIVIETTPRIVGLIRRSLNLECYPNFESILEAGYKPDHVIAMGSLPGIVNLSRKDARTDGYLRYDVTRQFQWRQKLKKMANGRRIVGVAWEGGVPQTHKALRNPPRNLFSTLDSEKNFLVSVQYTPGAKKQAEQMGFYHNQQAIDDLEEQVALIASLDCLVTVAQTAMHFAGATNTPCIGLIASKPRWDCIGEGNEMPWWNSVRLIHQKGDDWQGVFDQLNQGLSYETTTDQYAAE